MWSFEVKIIIVNHLLYEKIEVNIREDFNNSQLFETINLYI